MIISPKVKRAIVTGSDRVLQFRLNAPILPINRAAPIASGFRFTLDAAGCAATIRVISGQNSVCRAAVYKLRSNSVTRRTDGILLKEIIIGLTAAFGKFLKGVNSFIIFTICR